MAEVKWIKFYIDMFDKRKIKKIRRLPEGDKILLFWVMLLATAGKCNAGGMIFITENVPFEEEDLADEFDFEVNTIRLALETFVRLDMISISNEGYILVNGWEEYQSADKLAEIREQTRKRVAKCREKKMLAQGSVTSNVTVTLGNAIEEEKERDKEKEYHSIIHSNAREEEPMENFDDREEAKLRYLGGTLGGGVVLITDEQFDDLCDKLSLDELNKYIAIVRDNEKKGHHYTKKTHYQAILDMVKRDRRKK